MTIQLLFAEKDVKDLLSISDNFYSEFLRTAMYEAQEVYYAEVVGETMLDTLKDKAASTSGVTGIYETLLEKSRPYLCYITLSRVYNKASFKLSNIGAHQNTDENVRALSKAEIDTQIEDAEAQAMAHLNRLQKWMRKHVDEMPELCEANLHSATDCGILLGGYRGFEL